MKTLLALSAITLTSAMYAVPATASCADPRMATALSGMPHLSAQMSAAAANPESGEWEWHGSIVGTWLVTYTTEGAPGGEAFIQWHSDGTEWENINLPPAGGICMGSWKMIDAHRVFRNHFGWLFDSGMVSGYFNETETDTLSRDGHSYTGFNELKMFDLNGKMTADLTGTASATRLPP
jgi:hypothetical protein